MPNPDPEVIAEEVLRLGELATPGPWIKGKGSFTVYQGPLSENTESCVSGMPNVSHYRPLPAPPQQAAHDPAER